VAAAVVEAEEREVCGQLTGLKRPPRIIPDHERDPVPAKQLVRLLHEPARMAELEGMPAGRQLLEREGEPVVVPRKVGWELPEHRPELRRADEGIDPLVEPPDRLVHVREA